MVLHQLYSNLKALAKLKKNGKKVGKLRYKGKVVSGQVFSMKQEAPCVSWE